MRKQSLITISLLILFINSILFAGGPFAPKADIPSNPNDDPDLALAIIYLENIEVPDQEEVGVPAYPDAKIFQTNRAQEDMLPSVRLLSLDNLTKVVDFYKTELRGWKYKDFYGVHMFYNGKEQDAMFGKEPVVQIESADKFKHIIADAKVAITIGFKPKKEEKKSE